MHKNNFAELEKCCKTSLQFGRFVLDTAENEVPEVDFWTSFGDELVMNKVSVNEKKTEKKVSVNLVSTP